MTRKRDPRSAERSNTIILRSIGSLALATHELWMLARSDDASLGAEWRESARTLLEGSAAVMDAASGAPHLGDTISVVRKGAQVPVGPDYLDRLTQRIHRHWQSGQAAITDRPPADRGPSGG